MPRRNAIIFAGPVIFLLAVSLLPYIWIVLAGFKKRIDLLTLDPRWIFEPTWVNYSDILYKGFDNYLLNSIIIGFSSTALTVVWAIAT